jgi:hypothetical protein
MPLETQTLPPIAVTADQVKAMPQATRDATRAMYAKNYSAADVEAVFGPAAPVVNNTQTVVQNPGSHTFLRTDALNHDEAVRAAKHLIEAGVDPDRVLAAAIREGVSADDLKVQPSQQEIAANQREAETAKGFEPPAKGERYQLDYGRDFAEASDTADLAALDKDIQGAFAHAAVPKELAQPLLNALLETGAKYADDSLSDAAKQMIWRDEGALLRHSVSDLAETMRLAAVGYSALPASFRADLDSSFAAHSAAAQIQLANLGRALEYRAKR